VPDADLERAWPWRDDEADVRYGFYRAFETLDASAAPSARPPGMVTPASGSPPP
jgi:hypothetical protein